MNKIVPINIEWNCYNGFSFKLLDLELYKPINIDSALLGINFARNFCYIDILFFTIKVFENYES